MRVKVDIMLQIDLKKHDDRCIKIENLMKERGIKEESVEYSLKSYYLQIYQHDPLSVSYTHLDVYKRQVLQR